MNRLLDKSALLLLTIAAISGTESSETAVAIVLVSVLLSAVNQLLHKKKLYFAIIAIQLALCFINPMFCCAAPLIFYDILSTNKPWLALILPAAAAIGVNELTLPRLMIIFGGALSAFLLYRNTSRLAAAEDSLIKTRDSSEEVTLLLQEKNRRLLENQDYEINLATMGERNRIAREIHDNVGHMLTRSILQVGALSVINKDENLKDSLENLKDTLNNAMTSIRSSVHNLHDDSINLRLTAEEAIKPLSEKFTVNYSFDFSETMPKNIKLCFIGIIKECVSNAVKHSRGDKIDITIREHPAFYHLSYEDNGKCDGIIKDTGIGISNIRERAAQTDGFVNIESGENGFKVFVSVPKKEE